MPSLVSTRNLVLLPLLTLAVLLGLAALGPVSGADAASQQRVSRAANVALQQIGDPYRYGAAGPGAFDCSGLMYYSYRKAGISIPRTSSAQARRAHRIPKRQLRRGDLMFFTNGGGVYHAAMLPQARPGRRRDGALPGQWPARQAGPRVDRPLVRSQHARLRNVQPGGGPRRSPGCPGLPGDTLAREVDVRWSRLGFAHDHPPPQPACRAHRQPTHCRRTTPWARSSRLPRHGSYARRLLPRSRSCAAWWPCSRSRSP